MTRRTLLTSAILAVVLFGVGCGSHVSPTPKPVPLPTATFDVVPARESILVAGDIKVIVPSGTFTKIASVTVTRTRADSLPQVGGFDPLPAPQCKIITSERPNGPVILQSLNRARGRGFDTKEVYRYLQFIDGAWRVVNDVTDDIKLVIDKAAFSAANTVDGVLGTFIVNVPESGSRLLYMGGNPAANRYNVLIIVHGFNSRADDFWLAADRLAVEPMEERFRAIYGFEYDYRQSCRASALELVEQIHEVQRKGYANVCILAHSAGAVITRDALENLGIDRNVIYAYLINGAHRGSKWTTPADMAKGLEEQLINQSGGNAQSLLATYSDPIIADLTPNSPFLTELNRVKPTRTYTAYFVVGTWGDLIVGPYGGSPKDLDFTKFTSKLVKQTIVDGTHSSLLQTTLGLDSLMQILFHS